MNSYNLMFITFLIIYLYCRFSIRYKEHKADVVNELNHVKNESIENKSMKNDSLVFSNSVKCSGVHIRSFWDVHGDEAYQNIWPRDRKLDYAKNTVVVVYTEKGQGSIRIRQDSPSVLKTEIETKTETKNVKNAANIFIRGNSVVFLDPFDVMSYGCDGFVWKLYWIELFIDEDVKSTIPFNKVISIENRSHFTLQFKEIVEELAYQEHFHRAYAAAMFNKIVYEWLREANHTNKTSQQMTVQRIIDEMHLRLSENWSVKDMSQLAGCSEQHLRKLFLKYTGESPKQYYLTIKLDIAHALLKKGQYSITELAYEMGFSDAFHFSKSFKKRFALSPSEITPQQNHYTKNLLVHD